MLVMTDSLVQQHPLTTSPPADGMATPAVAPCCSAAAGDAGAGSSCECPQDKQLVHGFISNAPTTSADGASTQAAPQECGGAQDAAADSSAPQPLEAAPADNTHATQPPCSPNPNAPASLLFPLPPLPAQPTGSCSGASCSSGIAASDNPTGAAASKVAVKPKRPPSKATLALRALQTEDIIRSGYADATEVAEAMEKVQALPEHTLEAASSLLVDLPASLRPLVIAKSTERRGRGGRQAATDPRLDPSVDPQRARRILANRESAARSKLKAKLLLESQRAAQQMLAAKQRAAAAEQRQRAAAAAAAAGPNAGNAGAVCESQPPAKKARVRAPRNRSSAASRAAAAAAASSALPQTSPMLGTVPQSQAWPQLLAGQPAVSADSCYHTTPASTNAAVTSVFGVLPAQLQQVPQPLQLQVMQHLQAYGVPYSFANPALLQQQQQPDHHHHMLPLRAASFGSSSSLNASSTTVVPAAALQHLQAGDLFSGAAMLSMQRSGSGMLAAGPQHFAGQNMQQQHGQEPAVKQEQPDQQQPSIKAKEDCEEDLIMTIGNGAPASLVAEAAAADDFGGLWTEAPCGAAGDELLGVPHPVF